MTDPKSIQVQVHIPVYVRLNVTWDADEEHAVVHDEAPWLKEEDS